VFFPPLPLPTEPSLQRANKTFAKDEKIPTRITFSFQTVDKAILLNVDGQKDLHSSDDSDDLYIDGRPEKE
jgi:hypothetical protein